MENSNIQIIVNIFNYGSTIPPGDLERIFDRFYSNRDSKKENHNGLGLSIARSILDSYKGRISAENTEHGVLFTIILPVNN